MWTASFFLGNFAGPTVAGFLTERFGFRWASFLFFLINCFVLIVDLIELALNVLYMNSKHFDSKIQYSKLEQN
jgi:MFS family permease